MSLRSILIINDYATLCRLKDKNCKKSILAKEYLKYKISKALEKRNNSPKRIIHTLLSLILFRL
jgi:hypothetical protein